MLCWENNLGLLELSSINKVSLFFRLGLGRAVPSLPRESSSELIELSCINKVSLVKVSSCSNTGSMRDDPFWTSRKNSLELIELSSILYK